MNGLDTVGSVQLDRETYATFCRMVYDLAGITLRTGKESLVQARLGKRMRELKLTQVADYLKLVKDDPRGDELVLLLDAIATNTTSFFREAGSITFAAETVANWLKHGQRRFRVWSAASSTGEEPFTLAMVLDQEFEKSHVAGIDFAMLATDISTKVLDRCRKAVYAERALDPIPPDLRKRYFTRCGEAWQVVDRLRAMITFNRLNLNQPPFPMKGPFDIVFCRNVMIYFDDTVRRRLITEIHRLLRPDGFLMVGNAESLTSVAEGLYKPVKPAVYRKI
jgi:chemotaxis protein methyltransferase CheR